MRSMKVNINKKLSFNVIFRAEPEGGFTAVVPSLPGCISFGKTLPIAKKMILDAISGYIVSMKKRGEELPIGDEETFVSVVDLNTPLKYA